MTDPTLAISHPRLQRLYDYWQAQRGSRKMPARADLDAVAMSYVLGDVMLIDVTGDAPPRFRIRLHGSNLSQRAGYDLTGRVLDELPSSEFRAVVRDRLTEVAATGRPRRCRRDGLLDGRSYRYEAIMLPLSPDDDTVNMELVALIYD